MCTSFVKKFHIPAETNNCHIHISKTQSRTYVYVHEFHYNTFNNPSGGALGEIEYFPKYLKAKAYTYILYKFCDLLQDLEQKMCSCKYSS